jgi:hypothetical protein
MVHCKINPVDYTTQFSHCDNLSGNPSEQRLTTHDNSSGRITSETSRRYQTQSSTPASAPDRHDIASVERTRDAETNPFRRPTRSPTNQQNRRQRHPEKPTHYQSIPRDKPTKPTKKYLGRSGPRPRQTIPDSSAYEDAEGEPGRCAQCC